jgi:hypothetical protein
VAHKHVRRIDPGTVEQPLEIVDLIARAVHARPRDAATEASKTETASIRRVTARV